MFDDEWEKADARVAWANSYFTKKLVAGVQTEIRDLQQAVFASLSAREYDAASQFNAKREAREALLEMIKNGH